MKTSRVLTLAKQHLSRHHLDIVHKERYICLAITAAVRLDKIPLGSAQRVKKVVEGRLHPYATLSSWLQAKHGIDGRINSIYSKVVEYRNQLQATRHAWVDSMIAEFQAKGD